MEDAPTPSAWIDGWAPSINLETPAGALLREIVVLAPRGALITLFGSAPLQISLDGNFTSADVDCIGPVGWAQRVKEKELDDTRRSLYVQVCDSLSFRTSPLWPDRAFIFPLEGRRVRVPHPIDILIGKLHRMDSKDLKAFQMVRDKTGHPTEEELITELQNAVDLYRPGFDESQMSDMKVTTRILWREFFGKDIDVATRIIGPAQERRRASYAHDRSHTDHKAALKELSSEGKALPRSADG
jgi:hypothetical protein